MVVEGDGIRPGLERDGGGTADGVRKERSRGGRLNYERRIPRAIRRSGRRRADGNLERGRAYGGCDLNRFAKCHQEREILPNADCRGRQGRDAGDRSSSRVNSHCKRSRARSAKVGSFEMADSQCVRGSRCRCGESGGELDAVVVRGCHPDASIQISCCYRVGANNALCGIHDLDLVTRRHRNAAQANYVNLWRSDVGVVVDVGAHDGPGRK